MDAFGAAVTAVLTGLLLASERLKTGMPPMLLYSLAVLALGLMCYDLVCFFRSGNPAKSLRRIAALNLAYCGVVAALLLAYFNNITPLGFTYFILEIAIVTGLSFWEWNISRQASVIE
jgi:hypothetical protein